MLDALMLLTQSCARMGTMNGFEARLEKTDRRDGGPTVLCLMPKSDATPYLIAILDLPPKYLRNRTSFTCEKRYD
jgi:hypothetical protein